ncbi:MAG: N-acetylneuraminate synthase family protein [Candidatus Woesearchaeota archaeon]
MDNFLIQEKETLNEILHKFKTNNKGILFLVDSNKILKGILTSGDLIRNLEKNNLEFNLLEAVNTKFKYVLEDDEESKIEKIFQEKQSIQILPIVDKSFKVINLIFRDTFKKHFLSDKKTFIIAEIGNNHQGDINLAKKLVDEAVKANSDCAKFQMRDLQDLYGNKNSLSEDEDLGSQYVLNLLEKFQLSDSEMFEIMDYCLERGIEPICTPFDMSSLQKLEQYAKLQTYKVASCDLTNHDFIKALLKTGKNLIISTGMSSENEIQETYGIVKKYMHRVVFLHCNSTYPTPFKDVHLNYLLRLKTITNGVVGYSGHEIGIEVPIAAVALGAKVIEKHFTLDKNLEGNDHKVSLLPNEFKEMVIKIRNVEESLGHNKKFISQGELINRESLAKSLYTKVNLKKGDVITQEMIGFKSPGKGIQPNKKNKLIGTIAKRDIESGDFFYNSDIETQINLLKNFEFNRPFGVPVRYHDYKKMLDEIHPDFIEFHLSFSDLNLNLDSFFTTNEVIDKQVVVHCPELFENDHLLDLTSKDEEYRKKSIENLQRTIDISSQIKSKFNQKEDILLVTNIGGFNKNGFYTDEEKKELYEIFLDSLKKIDFKDVELIIQTMPPFPWHFGGSSYHNLFVLPDEIKQYCEENNLRICLDISHSYLTCNYYNLDFEEFIKQIGPYTAYLHVVDAKGIDGEGLQIGDGEINFEQIGRVLQQYCPNAPFIPEIWQGHKDNGFGFKLALTKLNKLL